MSFEVFETDLLARLGRLRTPHGSLETPALLPVVHPLRQSIPLAIMTSLGFRGVMTNAYITFKHSRKEAERRGIHSILGYDGIVMTDSGGYQVLEFGKVEVGVEQMAVFQETIHSDIAVILDKPTGYDVTRSFAADSVKATLESAKRSLEVVEDDDVLWAGAIQGGKYLDLVARCARQMAKMSFDLYALGSPTEMMESYDFTSLASMILEAKKHLPLHRPLHLFGAGHPLTLPLTVALGCDMFDSASYILYARRGKYITESGTLNLEKIAELPCLCDVCKAYTASEIMKSKEKEKLLAIHNLHALQKEVKVIREAIHGGRLWEHVFSKARLHPKLLSACSILKSPEIFEEGTPLFKSKAIFFSNAPDQFRPEVHRYVQRASKNLTIRRDRRLIVLLPEVGGEPLPSSSYATRIRSSLGDLGGKVQFFLLKIPFGAVPLEIADLYPLSQFLYPSQEPFAEEETAHNAAQVLRRFRKKELFFFYPKGWMPKLVKKISTIMLNLKLIPITIESWEKNDFSKMKEIINAASGARKDVSKHRGS